jgi:hypothetical protein
VNGRGTFNSVGIWLFLVMLFSAAAAGQLEPVAGMPMTLDGQVSAGYAGGSATGSGYNNGVFVGSTASLDGYYHDPRFLKFSLNPSYLWNSNSSGVEAGTHDNNEGLFSRVDFLSGSSMPLSFQYSVQRTNFSTLSSGDTPITLESTGVTQNYGVSWLVHKRQYPTFGISYSWGSSSADYTGVSGAGSTSTHSDVNLTSTYTLLGFNLGGTYSYSKSQEQMPDLLNLGLPTQGTTDISTENFTVQRRLPLTTQMNAQYSHTDDNYNLFGSPESLGFDIATATLVSTPLKRLTLNGSASYNSNTSAQLISQLISSSTPGAGTSGSTGTTTAGQTLLSTGHTLGFTEGGAYDAGRGFYLIGSASQQTSEITGTENLITDQYSAGVSYNRRLRGGYLGLGYLPGYEIFRVDTPAGIGTTATSLTSRGMTQSVTATYSRRISRWQGQGNFSYSDSSVNETATIPVLSRSFTGSVRANTRLWHQWDFTVNAAASDATVPGTDGSRNELVGVQISNRTWSFNAQEQLNSGYSVLSAAGIINVSLPVAASGLLNTTQTDSSGLAISVGYRRRALSLTSTFTDANSTLHETTGPDKTGTKNFDTRVTYRFRKVDVLGGYRWYSQMATSNGLLNQNFQTYWISVVRRFHLF